MFCRVQLRFSEISHCELEKSQVHWRNFANNMAEPKSTVGIMNFDLRRSQKEGEEWFELRLNIHIYTFSLLSPTATQNFLLRLSNIVAKKLLGRKNIRGAFVPHYPLPRVTRWRSWLRHCAASRKVAGSIPDGVIGIFR